MTRPSQAGIEARRTLVAQRLLIHKSVRTIADELANLPDGERPADCSAATIGRDARALRDEWAAQRAQLVDQLLDEDLARFAEIEASLIPKCRDGNGEAIDRWLRLQAARAQRTAPRPGPAGAQPAGTGAGVAIELRVRYVDDWREVRSGAIGATIVEVKREELTDGDGQT